MCEWFDVCWNLSTRGFTGLARAVHCAESAWSDRCVEQSMAGCVYGCGEGSNLVYSQFLLLPIRSACRLRRMRGRYCLPRAAISWLLLMPFWQWWQRKQLAINNQQLVQSSRVAE